MQLAIAADLSRKFRVLVFLSIVLVVVGHAGNLAFRFGESTGTSSSSIIAFLGKLTNFGLGHAGVALLFSISGYLFFITVGGRRPSEWFATKLKKSIWRLLVPYLLWSVLGLGAVFLMQSIPIFQPYFSKGLLKDLSARGLLAIIFISPIPYQLWFLRDLLVYRCLSPIIYVAVRHAPWLLLALTGVLFLIHAPLLFLRNDGPFFFSIGACLALRSSPWLAKLPTSLDKFLLPTWVAFLVSNAYSATYMQADPNNMAHRISIFTGAATLWFGYERWLLPLEPKLLKLAPYAFFVYLAHEPLETVVKKLLLRTFGPSVLGSLTTFCLTILITLMLTILAGYVLHRAVPGVYALLTGEPGRRPDGGQKSSEKVDRVPAGS